MNQARKELSLPSTILKPIIDLRKLSNRFFLTIKDAHHLMSAIHFFNMSINFAKLRLLAQELFLRALCDQRNNATRQRKHQ